MPSTRPLVRSLSLSLALALLISLCPAGTSWASPARGTKVTTFETPLGKMTVRHIPKSARFGETPPVADGDSYSFEHKLGADGVPCSSPHTQNTDDNTVLFDGLSELLDPYLDGTDPFVFEFETPDPPNNTNDVFVNSFSGSGGDLFPEGFEDPETGTPLSDACIEIGIDDTLDFDQPTEVESAMFEASDSNGEVIPPMDITSAFSNPFDGTLQIQFQNGAGQGINGTILDINFQSFEEPPLFADGFESGDATSWTDSVP